MPTENFGGSNIHNDRIVHNNRASSSSVLVHFVATILEGVNVRVLMRLLENAHVIIHDLK